MSGFARHTLAFVALLVLLALTTASAFIDLGVGNAVANLAIAALKAAIVIVIFMEFFGAGTLVKLTALSAALWLAILIGLTLWVSLASG